MAKPPPLAPPDKVALYDELIATCPGVVRKGAKSAYTSLNGHMFSFMDETGDLALRLPKDEREAFLVTHKTRLSVQYNTVMKEYVVVPEAMLKNTRRLAPVFAMSHDYVASLKPKPTTKKKAGAKKR